LDESQTTNIKQVIVMRHDLKMRRGKQIAQGAHASMAFLTRRLQSRSSISMDDFSLAL
jgi:PTH2 family peptidyl-tRNA hydrolase